MLNFLKAVFSILADLLGLSSPKYLWEWCGEPGWSRWSLEFSHDGFTYRALLAADLHRPDMLGRFVSFPGPDTVSLDGNAFYIPSKPLVVLKQEFMDAGMSAVKADRACRTALENEMFLTDQYERGFWKTYSAVVTIKRGRSELASLAVDGIRMDPARLILGGEVHVTEAVLNLRERLKANALQKLKGMAAPVLHFH